MNARTPELDLLQLPAEFRQCFDQQRAAYLLVLPQQPAVSKANEAFDDTGVLKDARQQQAVADIARRLVALANAQR